MINILLGMLITLFMAIGPMALAPAGLLLGPSGTKLLAGPEGRPTQDTDCCCERSCCTFDCEDHPTSVFLTMTWSDCDVLTGTFELVAECTEGTPDEIVWLYEETVGDCVIQIRMVCEQCVLVEGQCYGIQIVLTGAGIECILVHLECYIVSCDPFELDVVYDTSSDCADEMYNCGCNSFTFSGGSVSE